MNNLLFALFILIAITSRNCQNVPAEEGSLIDLIDGTFEKSLDVDTTSQQPNVPTSSINGQNEKDGTNADKKIDSNLGSSTETPGMFKVFFLWPYHLYFNNLRNFSVSDKNVPLLQSLIDEGKSRIKGIINAGSNRLKTFLSLWNFIFII